MTRVTRLRQKARIVTVYEVTGEYNIIAIGRVTNVAAIGTMFKKLTRIRPSAVSRCTL